MAAGAAHTVAVTDSAVYAWGCNGAGQLGTRTFADKAAPTEVRDLEGAGVVSVACGAEHTLFLCRRALSLLRTSSGRAAWAACIARIRVLSVRVRR